MLISFFLIITQNCKTALEITYNSNKEKSKYEKLSEEIYLNNVPEEQQKTDKEVLLIFNGLAFKGKTLFINKNDSLVFTSLPDQSGCYGILFKKIGKTEKNIKLSVSGKKDVIIPIDLAYDYMEIGDSYDKNKWGVVYRKIFPNFSCY